MTAPTETRASLSGWGRPTGKRDTTRRGCAHPVAQHEHGTRAAYVHDRCRCDPCRTANRTDQNAARRRALYGHAAYVDAEPARAHVNHLRAQGMGWKRIADVAGLHQSVLTKLLWGQRGYPSRRIRPTTARQILAVRLDLAPSALVDARRTWDLIHGLIAHGYPKVWIAQQIGHGGARSLQLRADRVTRAHADAVAALAEEHAGIPGPSARARSYAAWHGWTPDLLWSDLDDEAPIPVTVDAIAVERACAGDQVRLTITERREVVRRLHRLGLNDREIQARTGMSDRTVLRIRQELGLSAVAA